MAIINGYTTLALVKDALETSETVHDTLLELSVETASRAIDKATNRRFWQDASVADRYFAGTGGDAVHTDDISTSTGLVVVGDVDGDGTFETTYTLNTDFVLAPRSAAADSAPWTLLRRLSAGKTFPTCGEDRIKVTAKFGWAAVPTDIAQACLLQAVRLFNRKHAPFGVAGSPQEGSEMRLLARLDPDVEALVRPYRRLVIAP